MSGSDAHSNDADDRLRVVEEILGRGSPIDAIGALSRSFRPPIRSLEKLERSALGLDANVFLRMGRRNLSDVPDYLGSQHTAPLILPGQVVQEFWNNQLSSIESIAKNIEKSFRAFDADLTKMEDAAPELREDGFRLEMKRLLGQFHQEHGYLYDDATLRQMQSIIDMLKEKAKVPFVPRERFQHLAAWRKRTKTPPGFKDDSDGDFYVWSDFLYGLVSASAEGASFDQAVLVTNDVKPDWSRGGIPHPILSAEVAAACNVPFEVWTLDEVATAIRASRQ